MKLLLRRLAWLSAMVLAAISVGVAGFMTFARLTFFEALYMATMTVTTIGYGEIHPLGDAGRAFNVFFMLFGSGTLLLSLGVMTSTILELQLGGLYEKRRVRRMINKLNNHFIVCGFGRVGRGAALELLRSGVPFVVIDHSDDRVEWVIRQGMLAVAADATRDEALRDSGIERARGVVCALASDADNLFLTLSAKQLNPRLSVAARVNEDEAEQKMRRAGADQVFAPYNFTGARLAQSILRPHVTQFLDFTTQGLGLNVVIEQVRVAETSEFASKSLRELKQLRSDLGISVLAIRRASGQMTVNPGADASINGGDFLIVMGEPDALRQLERLFAEAVA
jgi:voltage-gated potassium channel